MESNGRSTFKDEASQTDIDTRTLKLLHLGDSEIELTETMPLYAIEDLYNRFVGSLNMHLTAFTCATRTYYMICLFVCLFVYSVKYKFR